MIRTAFKIAISGRYLLLCGIILSIQIQNVMAEIDYVEPTCSSIEKFSTRVGRGNLHTINPTDSKNIEAALEGIADLKKYEHVYYFTGTIGSKGNIGSRTIIFPKLHCREGCIGYIVRTTERGLDEIKFLYKENYLFGVSHLGNEISHNAVETVSFLSIDGTNIVSMFNLLSESADKVENVLVSSPEQSELVYASPKTYKDCLDGLHNLEH